MGNCVGMACVCARVVLGFVIGVEVACGNAMDSKRMACVFCILAFALSYGDMLAVFGVFGIGVGRCCNKCASTTGSVFGFGDSISSALILLAEFCLLKVLLFSLNSLEMIGLWRFVADDSVVFCSVGLSTAVCALSLSNSFSYLRNAANESVFDRYLVAEFISSSLLFTPNIVAQFGVFVADPIVAAAPCTLSFRLCLRLERLLSRRATRGLFVTA